MKTLLLINASGRETRSITRNLTARYAERWLARHRGAAVISRDVGISPPAPVWETWIAAAFEEPSRRTPAMRDALAASEKLIGELERADEIVIGAPIYNFGMPAQLKAYIDQVVRAGRTFAFDGAGSAEPYRPLLDAKPVIVIVSAGDGSLHPGGELEHLNFLEPHLRTVLGFIGLTDLTFVRVGYDEFKDERFARSVEAAEAAIDDLAAMRE